MSGEAPDAEVLARLAEPAAHPGDPSATRGVEWVQTHLSNVFLTRERVYKFRKPVDLGFVRFVTRAERNADCEREVTLNRRLAPDVYLGIAALEAGPRIGAVRESPPSGPDAPECCVVMRRLPDGRDALSLLEAGALTGEQLEATARRIARFHASHSLGRPAPFTPSEWHERCLAPVEANFRALGGSRPGLDGERVARAREAAGDFVERHAARFDRRRREGRAVDGHGDLHLQHLWFEGRGPEPLVIDCVEFNEELRHIDAASDAAFLYMDLRYRDHPKLAERFLRSYAAETDDFDLYGVVEYFVSYRAGVRAKVAALAAADAGIAEAQRSRAEASAREHLALAAEALEPPKPGGLVLVAGVVGTGKSTVAAALADQTGAVVVASDRVRKQCIGLAPGDRAGAAADRGLYAPAEVDRVYAAMLERAEPVVASGRLAILDATFARREHRLRAAGWAHERGVPVAVLEVRCAPELAVARLARRAAAGGDPSDAGPELYETLAARFEPIAGEGHVEVLRTDDEGWPDVLRDIASGLPH